MKDVSENEIQKTGEEMINTIKLFEEKNELEKKIDESILEEASKIDFKKAIFNDPLEEGYELAGIEIIKNDIVLEKLSYKMKKKEDNTEKESEIVVTFSYGKITEFLIEKNGNRVHHQGDKDIVYLKLNEIYTNKCNSFIDNFLLDVSDKIDSSKIENIIADLHQNPMRNISFEYETPTKHRQLYEIAFEYTPKMIGLIRMKDVSNSKISFNIVELVMGENRETALIGSNFYALMAENYKRQVKK